MFRAEIHQLADRTTLGLEGRFAGEWAKQAKSLITEGSIPAKLVIDLSEVSYVDSVGEQVLIWFGSIGALFVAETSYTRDVCERLHLFLERDSGNPSNEKKKEAARPRR
jgi:hypothetical protein